MWQFAIALCLLILYPGSLLMPGIYGLVSTLIVAMFATLVGDLVDTNPRLRGIVEPDVLNCLGGLIAIDTVYKEWLYLQIIK